MPIIENTENNVKLELNLINNSMFDYQSSKSDYENWIPFIILLETPQKTLQIKEFQKATMTVGNIFNLIEGIYRIVNSLENKKDDTFDFFSIEADFEIVLNTLIEDDIIEVIFWLNIANQTKGKIYGYDEGIKFFANSRILMKFAEDIKNQLYFLTKNKI